MAMLDAVVRARLDARVAYLDPSKRGIPGGSPLLRDVVRLLAAYDAQAPVVASAVATSAARQDLQAACGGNGGTGATVQAASWRFGQALDVQDAAVMAYQAREG